MAKVEDGKLSDFKPQTNNANEHTERGLKALTDAYSSVGYVAPMTAAADGEIIDGSARLEQAFDQFGDEALVIKHDGKRPIVMIREDVENAETPRAKQISYGANRIGEIDLQWNPEQVLADLDAGVELDGLFYENELEDLLETMPTEEEWGETFGNLPDGDKSPYTQMTFTLHDAQIEVVKIALGIAKKSTNGDGVNENSNGNALSYMAEMFLETYGEG